MGAAREQCRQNHQIPWREKPMFSLISKALGGACDKAQAMTLREIVEMLGANPRKVCHLGIGEDLLARFDGYHWFNSSQFLQSSNLKNSDAIQRLRSSEDLSSFSMVRTASTSKTPIQAGRPGKKQSSAPQARGCRRCLIRSSCLAEQTRGSPQQA
jgi:hypothetical protein